MDDECNCEFDPYDPEDYKASEEMEESWHYKRTPFDRPTPMQLLYGGRRYGTSIR